MKIEEIKKKVSELIEKDEEFRYFIASKIGLLEILKRLEKHDERFEEILKKMAEHDKKFNEIMEEIKRLREKAAEHDRKFNEILAKIAEHDKKFNEILAEIVAIRKGIAELKRFQDKVSVSTEEEAIEVVEYFLEKNHGIKVSLETIYIDSKAEIDFYGVKGDLCVFGEATVRLGLSKIKDLLNKFNYVRRNFPYYLREKVILALYGMRVLPKVKEEAEKYGIWVVTTNKEVTKLKIKRLEEIETK